MGSSRPPQKEAGLTWNGLEISILLIGCLVAVAGKYLGFPNLTSIGTGLVAFDMALVGLESVVTRKMKWGITWYSSETYQGIAAVALGLILVIAGMGFGALVIAQALGSEQSLFGLLFSRPGPIFLLVGGPMFLRGLAGVIGALEWDWTALSRVLNGILERLAMLILLLLGSGCLLLGGLEIFAPSMFQLLTSGIWQAFLLVLGIR